MTHKMKFNCPLFHIGTPMIFAFCAMLCTGDAISATAQRTAVKRANNAASRVPTMTIRTQNTSSGTTGTSTTPDAPATTTPSEPATEPEIIKPEPDVEEPFEFEDRTSTFDAAIGDVTRGDSFVSDDDFASQIRSQRAALNAASAELVATEAANNAVSLNQNACDSGLRSCMAAKCGTDYAKCSGDGDTIWGDKMDACRRDVECTGEEYRIFSTEIKADRDMNARLANYTSIISCGNKYNACIIEQCGKTYSKCLGKSAGDLAISKCKKIADECTQMDNGLASRTMNVFATLRQTAEKQIQRDEKRLYALRDEMATVCRNMGAMFDQRSLDCVYTVNFFAGEDLTTPYASKKAYAGSTFDCNQNWFGIDITTFKENAYRLTREQKSATSALMGAGIGVAAGAISSGAINRAIDRHKADKAADEAEDYVKDNFEKDSDKGKNNNTTGGTTTGGTTTGGTTTGGTTTGGTTTGGTTTGGTTTGGTTTGGTTTGGTTTGGTTTGGTTTGGTTTGGTTTGGTTTGGTTTGGTTTGGTTTGGTTTGGSGGSKPHPAEK